MAEYEAVATRTAILNKFSHELCTPLNGIIGMGQLLQQTPLNQVRHYC